MLLSLGNDSDLSYSEFPSALYLDLIWQMNIKSVPGCRAGKTVQYGTPNFLLLGRASQSGDFRAFDFTTYPYKRGPTAPPVAEAGHDRRPAPKIIEEKHK